MKKLIIALFAIASAFAANAAACNWSASAIAVSATGASSVTDYTAYLINPATIAIADMTDALKGGDLSWLSNADATANLIAVGTTAGRIGKSGFGDYTPGESYTYYTVILNNGVTSATQFMITDAVTKQTPASGSLAMGFGSQASNAWTDIAPVPEPTSGLLLLLGMAGLALKRKHA